MPEKSSSSPPAAAANPDRETERIRRILAGEKQLFHELIRPCERPIYRMLLGILGSEADAEDAAQETAIKALDGKVEAVRGATIEPHLETCEICSAVLDSTRNVVVLVADDRVFELPAGFSRRLHERLGRELALGGD